MQQSKSPPTSAANKPRRFSSRSLSFFPPMFASTGHADGGDAASPSHRRSSFTTSEASPPVWVTDASEQGTAASAGGHGGSSYVGSPYSRAGLLTPRSYASSVHHHNHHYSPNTPSNNPPTPHDSQSGGTTPRPTVAVTSPAHHFPTPSDIRASTMEISSMTITPPPPLVPAHLHHPHALDPVDERGAPVDEPSPPELTGDTFVFPLPPSTHTTLAIPPPSRAHSGATDTSSSPFATPSRTPTQSSTSSSTPTEADPEPKRGRTRPSGLSLLLAAHDERAGLSTTPGSSTGEGSPTPTGERRLELPRVDASPPPMSNGHHDRDRRPRASAATSEHAPLLGDVEAARYGSAAATVGKGRLPPDGQGPVGRLAGWADRARKTRWSARGAEELLGTCVRSLPAVLLGGLLNILDGISYGMIIFPAAGVFADLGLGPVGVSMFFVSAIISQLVYSFGASGFAGGNGSMMIEVVPFFHIIANSIADHIGNDRPEDIVATTLVAFAFSSILTGLTFFLLGALRLGALIGFFPRHILVGCIGGVGVFLMITGFMVSARMDDDDFGFTLEVFKYFFLNAHILSLWVPALALAVLLRVITHKFHHQLIFPAYFLVIPVIFYIVVLGAGFDLGVLRSQGWLFDVGDAREPWWRFYTYFNFKRVHWDALGVTMPTQFALLFFNILHPPLNVPALAVSLDEDVDTNKELVAHGYSNLLAGVLGTVPNYLVYVNTLLFYRVGGDTRTAGFLLAAATAGLLVIGTGPIAYIPVMVVGALIFVLGIDLVKEALWDCRHRVTRTEYITIVSIMVAMTAFDFVMGVLLGIVVSCVFFVVQNSQRRSIRALFTGESSMSTVRRPSAHREYLQAVSKQTAILRLQGFLFFGTITNVEETIRALVESASWQKNPIRFLVVDLSLVAGVDMSATEAFVRVQRILSARHIVLCFCGAHPDSAAGKALQSVGLLEMEGVEFFSSFNDAMEWTENAYLRSWFMTHKAEAAEPVSLPGRQRGVEFSQQMSVAATPRWLQLHEAGTRTIGQLEQPGPISDSTSEPFNTLQKVVAPHTPLDRQRFQPLIALLERMTLAEGDVLFSKGDRPDGLYLIESGVLRATYQFADFTPHIEESMVPGTIAGELSALSGEPRNATVVAERDAVVWKLSMEGMHELEMAHPDLAREFMKMVLKTAKIDLDILLSALATRQ